jgi:D-xylose transport system substrate-binding protein
MRCKEDEMRTKVALMSLVAALALWGCGGGSATPAKAARGAEPPVKIGLLLDNLHERWARDRDMIQEVVTDMHGELLVAEADSDHAKQLQQAEKMLDDGVKALIIVAHDTDKAAEIVDKANAKNVPVIAYDRLIQNADVTLYIGFDISRVGHLQAAHVLAAAPKGNYILIGGSPSDGNAKVLREAQMKVLEPEIKKGAIKVVGDGWAKDWSADAAASITEQGLAKERPGCSRRGQQRRDGGRSDPRARSQGAGRQGGGVRPGCRARGGPAHRRRHADDDRLQVVADDDAPGRSQRGAARKG